MSQSLIVYSEVLSIVGDPYYQAKVLRAWEFIELDEPLQKRRRALEQNCAKGDPFWNIHVALAFMA